MMLRKGLAVVALVVLMAPQSQADYRDHPKARSFVDEMVAEHGFERDQLLEWLSRAERKDGIIESISRPAEKVLTWKEYRPIFLTEARTRQGREFMAEYSQALSRAREQYGVDPAIIAAVIGVETAYGRKRGDHRVIDALATLAFDYPPRSRFFRSELKHFLLLSREQGFDPLALKGSYAGAMGYGQFIASSYRHYGVDFDEDGVAEILDNPVDAIGSVANYLSEHRWQRGGPVADRVEPSAGTLRELTHEGLDLPHTVSDFRVRGMELPPERDNAAAARLLTLKGAEGPEHWLVYRNFRVITRYNHSDLYAMAVYQLSRTLDEGDEG